MEADEEIGSALQPLTEFTVVEPSCVLVEEYMHDRLEVEVSRAGLVSIRNRTSKQYREMVIPPFAGRTIILYIISVFRPLVAVPSNHDAEKTVAFITNKDIHAEIGVEREWSQDVVDRYSRPMAIEN